MRSLKNSYSFKQTQIKTLNSLPRRSLSTNKRPTVTRENHSSIILYNKKIKSFSNVDAKNNCSFIDLSLNHLTNFTNFPTSLLYLTTLVLDSNQIRSFQGIQTPCSFPRLRFLSMKNNPITKCVYFKIMCIVVFGTQLCTINGEKINDNQKQTANKIRKYTLTDLSQGKIITSLHPLRISEISSEKTIDHSIDHNDKKKKSPNSKTSKSKKVHSKSKCNEASPSVGCLVNMIQKVHKSCIEKVVQKLFLANAEKLDNNNNNDDDQCDVKNISHFSLLNAIIVTKKRMRFLREKFNESDLTCDASSSEIEPSNKKERLSSSYNESDFKIMKKLKKESNEIIESISIVNDQNELKNQSNENSQLNSNKQKTFISAINNDEQSKLDNEEATVFDDQKQNNKLNESKENSMNSKLNQAQNSKKKDESFDILSLLKIIVEPAVESELEMVYEFPEACQELILDDEF